MADKKDDVAQDQQPDVQEKTNAVNKDEDKDKSVDTQVSFVDAKEDANAKETPADNENENITDDDKTDDINTNEEAEDVENECKQQETIQAAKDTLKEEIVTHVEDILKHLKASAVFSAEQYDQVEKAEDNGQAELLLQVVHKADQGGKVLLDVLEKLELNKAVDALQVLIQHHKDTTVTTVTTVTTEEEITSEMTPEQTIVKPPAALSYRDVLRESYGTFVDSLQLTPELLSILLNSVLNQDMVNKVVCRPNRPEKVRQLLRLLLELGPYSLRQFIQALRETDQHYLANILAAKDFI